MIPRRFIIFIAYQNLGEKVSIGVAHHCEIGRRLGDSFMKAESVVRGNYQRGLPAFPWRIVGEGLVLVWNNQRDASLPLHPEQNIVYDHASSVTYIMKNQKFLTQLRIE